MRLGGAITHLLEKLLKPSGIDNDAIGLLQFKNTGHTHTSSDHFSSTGMDVPRCGLTNPFQRKRKKVEFFTI